MIEGFKPEGSVKFFRTQKRTRTYDTVYQIPCQTSPPGSGPSSFKICKKIFSSKTKFPTWLHCYFFQFTYILYNWYWKWSWPSNLHSNQRQIPVNKSSSDPGPNHIVPNQTALIIKINNSPPPPFYITWEAAAPVFAPAASPGANPPPLYPL